jgi:Protein of unknown function DUF262
VPFQTPITIKQALERISKRAYVLPAIQREFVWNADQVCELFDSLLRKYPIGAFLFWEVEAARSMDFVFYEVMRKYHERDNRYCDRLPLAEPQALTAILDGQQRLTALNIGLTGTYADKLPRKWVRNQDAYPDRELFLDLCHQAPEDDRGMRYRFELLPPTKAVEDRSETTYWYRVRDILGVGDGEMDKLYAVVEDANLESERRKAAFRALNQLWQAIHVDPVIAYHQETDQDLDRVLHIFIRVNSGGTKLSYSDLLMSIATSEWKNRDAREAVASLVEQLNQVGQGFAFSKDIVLKAGLMMIDSASVGFKVENFHRTNMQKLDENWDNAARALTMGAKLLASFGFSFQTLTASSVLIPIADYLHARGLGESYLTAGQFAEDRERIRAWTIRSLVKRGIWGSGLDSLLTAIRKVVRDRAPLTGFPVAEIEEAMRQRGKTLRFEPADIDDLVQIQYGSPRVFPLLVLLYPGVDVRNEFHVDHVFPKSLFTQKGLAHAGIPEGDIEVAIQSVNRLPNLQLLEGSVNIAKQATLPSAWAFGHFPTPEAVGLYLAGHDLVGLPGDLSGFLAFFAQREAQMRDRLSGLLGVSVATEPEPEVEEKLVPLEVDMAA